jgi:transposase
MDSTTISLFTEVMRGAGSPRRDGKKKGGVKVHTLINARHDLPAFVSITEGKTADISQLQYISLPEGSTIIFDKAYVSYVMFKEWGDKINWITRLRQTASFVVQKKLKLTPESLKAGVQTDQNIKLGRESNQRKTPLIDARLIHFYDAEKKRSFEFITNDFTSPPEQIAQYYKRRWQIELLFKRIKQRYPLRYFLGDSANAIKIQIWAALICDLLVQVIKNRVNTMRKNKWSYANIAALIKHHLMTYISLIEFLKNPEKAALQYQPPDGQLQLWGLSP